MPYTPSRRIDGPTVAAITLSILVFAYVAIRAARLCITIDEAATYLDHVTGPWRDILLFRTDGLPDNNHLLHTLLCKLTVSLFGLSELTLRMPALLGCLAYLVGLNLCLRHIVSGWKILPALLVVGLNPYVVDFLGLARGYGLGLGCTMLGLAALLSWFNETGRNPERAGTARAAIAWFCMALLSNLSFLLVLGAAMALIAWRLIRTGSFQDGPGTTAWQWLRRLLGIIWPAIPALAYMALPVILIRQLQLFGEGGHTGFWFDTVTGLAKGTAYNSPLMWQHLDLLLLWVLLAGLFIPVALRVLYRSDRQKSTPFFVLAAMTIIVIIESLAQHYLFNVAYLEGRRGIFLIPLFLLTVLAYGQTPRHATRWYAVPAQFLGFLVPLLLAVHDLSCLNLKVIVNWNNYEGTRPAMLAIRDAIGSNGTRQPKTLRVNDEFTGTMRFYREMYGMENMLAPIGDEGLDGAADFYYGNNSDAAIMADNGARPFLRHQASGTILFRRGPMEP